MFTNLGKFSLDAYIWWIDERGEKLETSECFANTKQIKTLPWIHRTMWNRQIRNYYFVIWHKVKRFSFVPPHLINSPQLDKMSHSNYQMSDQNTFSSGLVGILSFQIRWGTWTGTEEKTVKYFSLGSVGDLSGILYCCM